MEQEKYLADSLLHIIRERECDEKRKLVVELRRPPPLKDSPSAAEQSPQTQGDRSADIETLRKLQEKARHPDLKRVTLKGS
jgi:hypothetical protein